MERPHPQEEVTRNEFQGSYKSWLDQHHPVLCSVGWQCLSIYPIGREAAGRMRVALKHLRCGLYDLRNGNFIKIKL